MKHSSKQSAALTEVLGFLKNAELVSSESESSVLKPKEPDKVLQGHQKKKTTKTKTKTSTSHRGSDFGDNHLNKKRCKLRGAEARLQQHHVQRQQRHSQHVAPLRGAERAAGAAPGAAAVAAEAPQHLRRAISGGGGGAALDPCHIMP